MVFKSGGELGYLRALKKLGARFFLPPVAAELNIILSGIVSVSENERGLRVVSESFIVVTLFTVNAFTPYYFQHFMARFT